MPEKTKYIVEKNLIYQRIARKFPWGNGKKYQTWYLDIVIYGIIKLRKLRTGWWFDLVPKDIRETLNELARKVIKVETLEKFDVLLEIALKIIMKISWKEPKGAPFLVVCLA